MEGDLPSHIVSFSIAHGELTMKRLTAAGILTTYRDGRVRAGFHAFNDHTDVERAVAALGGSDT